MTTETTLPIQGDQSILKWTKLEPLHVYFHSPFDQPAFIAIDTEDRVGMAALGSQTTRSASPLHPRTRRSQGDWIRVYQHTG